MILRDAEQPWDRSVQWLVRLTIVAMLIVIFQSALYDVDWYQVIGGDDWLLVRCRVSAL